MPVRKPIGPADRCGDCGVQTRGWHHFGCDLELCPRCRGQMISCGCATSDQGGDEPVETIILAAAGVIVHPEPLRGRPLPVSAYDELVRDGLITPATATGPRWRPGHLVKTKGSVSELVKDQRR